MASAQLGWYTWSYAGGEFLVALRDAGVFYCPEYATAKASWTQQAGTGTLYIDWAKYGKYELAPSAAAAAAAHFEGAAVGKPASWRRMAFLRPFSPEEGALIQSGGTEWSFEWSGGAFPVQFRGDGLNHFVCPQFPAHSHWSQDGANVTINWDRYGVYEMVLDAAAGTMVGCKRGDPSNWRRARFVRPLGPTEALEGITDHDHSHKHGEHCNH